MTFTRLARWGVVVIALHNLEEALTMPHWLAPRLATLEMRFGIRPLSEDTTRFYAGLVVATLIPALWIAMTVRAAPRTAASYSIVLLYGVFFANALAPHLVGAVLLGGYVPGIVTAAALVIPFSIWLAARAVRDGYASISGLALAVFCAFALYLPVLSVLLGVWR